MGRKGHMEGGIAGTVTGTHHGSCRELRGMSAPYCCRSPTPGAAAVWPRRHTPNAGGTVSAASQGRGRGVSRAAYRAGETGQPTGAVYTAQWRTAGRQRHDDFCDITTEVIKDIHRKVIIRDDQREGTRDSHGNEIRGIHTQGIRDNYMDGIRDSHREYIRDGGTTAET